MMAATIEPGTIRRVALGVPCPGCGDRDSFDAKRAAGGRTIFHHNRCGYQVDREEPWDQYVEQAIKAGHIRYGGEGSTLIHPGDIRPGMESAIYKDPAEKTGACFIATAVYGSPNAWEVVELRRFRDDVLLRTRPGRAFVRSYYRASPQVAAFLVRRRALRYLGSGLLSPIAAAMRALRTKR